MTEKNANCSIALAHGLARYNGSPCKNCGKTERYTCNNGCISCAITASLKYFDTPKGKKATKKIDQKYSKSEKGRKTDKRKWLKRYGLTIEEFNQMHANQNGKCLICEQEKPLCIDHCHRTDKIRGLLCLQCNTAIGSFYDNVLYMKNAIQYLEKE